MELLLINHPLDCPMCDKGGECPLQNQAMSHRPRRLPLPRAQARVREADPHLHPGAAGPRALRALPALHPVLRGDRRRQVHRPDGPLVRRADQRLPRRLLRRRPATAGGDEGDVPFNSYFSGNTVQICPVGALTGAQYRFRARPFDLVSSPSVCEHCSAGCAQRTDHRRGKVLRRLAGDDPAVNEEWNCDKGRWGFQLRHRLRPAHRRRWCATPRPASCARRRWTRGAARRRPRACARPATARTASACSPAAGSPSRTRTRTRSSPGSRCSTNDIDFRARPLVAREEADFLAAAVAGVTDVTYADVENAPAVVLVGLEPEEECPILFLRLRKAHAQEASCRCTAVAPFAQPGLGEARRDADRRPCPGDEAGVLGTDAAVARRAGRAGRAAVVGERLADRARRPVRGRARWPTRTGAQAGLGAAPRRRPRRGRRRLPAQPAARRPSGHRRGGAGRAGRRPGASRPACISGSAGRDTDAIIAAAAARQARRAGGRRRRPGRPGRPAARRGRRWTTVDFLVSLELRQQRGDPPGRRGVPGRPGGREGRHLPQLGGPAAHVRARCSTTTGDDRRPGARRARRASSASSWAPATWPRSAASWARCRPSRTAAPGRAARSSPRPRRRAAARARRVLATWHQLIDLGSLLDGDEVLAGTARPPVVRLAKAPRRRARRRRRRPGHGRHRPGRDHPAGRDHRACPTAWSGCPPTRRARPCAARLGVDRRCGGHGRRRSRPADCRRSRHEPRSRRTRRCRLRQRPRGGSSSSRSSASSSSWLCMTLFTHLVRAQGRGPDGRCGPAPTRSARSACCSPRRRPEAGVQGRHHADARRTRWSSSSPR